MPRARCLPDRYKGVIVSPAPRPKRSAVGLYIAAITMLLVIIFMMAYGVGATRQPSAVSIGPSVSSANSTSYPPDTLLINGERWRVWPTHYAPQDGYPPGTEAHTECETRRIFFEPDVGKGHLRENIWHEVIHANFCGKTTTWKADWMRPIQNDKQHAGVYALGMFLPGFVHDNPEFMRWAEDWK